MNQTVITIKGQENINLVYSSMILGMLELIEDKKISHSDANMILFLPLMLRDKHFSDGMKRAIGLCTELEAVSEAIPSVYQETLDQIKEICKKEVDGYARKDSVSYKF